MLPAAKNAAATARVLNLVVMMDHPFFLIQEGGFLFPLSLLYPFPVQELLGKYEENMKREARNVPPLSAAPYFRLS
jgi:hypothetical protein